MPTETGRRRERWLRRALHILVFTIASCALLAGCGGSSPPTGSATVTGTSAPTPTSAGPFAPLSWSFVPSPSPTSTSNSELNAVATVAAHDVWAVGWSTVNTTPVTLTEQWNGTHWTVVPSPNVPGVNNLLDGVAAVSANDVWAVGFSNPGNTLTENWNGTAWSIIPSPNAGPAGSFNILNGVAAVAANDVWAVGEYSDSSGYYQTLIENWNGAVWSIVPSPNALGATTNNTLNGVTAVRANYLWAVGYYQSPSPGENQTLTEQWYESHWRVVPSPSVGGTAVNNQLNGVTAVTTHDVWAVGYFNLKAKSPRTQTLTEHWNGLSWSVVPSPNGSATQSNALFGVAAVATNDVWAVGYFATPANTPQTLTEQWNGLSWSVVPSPNLNGAGTDNEMLGVAEVAANEVWAVGTFASPPNNINQPLTWLYS